MKRIGEETVYKFFSGGVIRKKAAGLAAFPLSKDWHFAARDCSGRCL